jgi:hypothetical protein
MGDDDRKSREYRSRLERRRQEISLARDAEASGAAYGMYGFLFWHPVVGRVTAIVILSISVALTIAAAKSATPYIEYTDVLQRAILVLFVIFAVIGLITSPPRAALGFEIGLFSGGLIAYCFWIGVSVWQFIVAGTFANIEILTATIVICLPLMTVVGYCCKRFSSEPLIPRSEQFFFFKSGNFTELDETPSFFNRLSGKRVGYIMVTILGLVFAALQTAWTVLDLPKLKL